MKNLLLLIALVFGAWQWWQSAPPSITPLYDKPYVAVYGRNSCGFTQKMLTDLRRSGVNYRYFSVDNQSTATTLHQRMEASGISTRRYNLPVVDANGELSVRPALQAVLNQYSAGG